MSKRKLLIVIALVLALSVLAVPVVLADAGPHGGPYTDTTPACAGCHRAHTGTADKMLATGGTEQEFCFSCHGTAGTGAATNVQDGVWMDPTSRSDPYGSSYANNVVGRGLRGGGFVNTRMSTDLSTTGVFSTTSKHRVETPGVTLWGDGNTSSTPDPGSSVTLKCTSCHDPHGTGNYRILRSKPKIQGGTVTGQATPPDPTDKVYTIADANGIYYGESYSDTDIAKLSDWCATCHTRLHGDFGDSGDAIYRYRHNTQGTNTSQNKNNGTPACLTCHVVHGSSAKAEGYAGQVYKPGSTTEYLDSSLLRVDNRGVCQLCHNK